MKQQHKNGAGAVSAMKRGAAAVSPEHQEHMALTSNWADEGLEPIKPWWRRLTREPSSLDGTMMDAVTPLTDAQLIWLARCLQPNEKYRLDRIWQQIVMAPLEPAVAAMKEIDERPKRLLKRRGTHSTPLGNNPLVILLSRLVIHRVRALALEAVTSLPAPKQLHSDQIADYIFVGLSLWHLIDEEQLKDHIRIPLHTVMARVRKIEGMREIQRFTQADLRRTRRVLRNAVKSALDKRLHKDRSRAFWITQAVIKAIGIHLPERSLKRILARPVLFRVLPDLIRRDPA